MRLANSLIVSSCSFPLFSTSAAAFSIPISPMTAAPSRTCGQTTAVSRPFRTR